MPDTTPGSTKDSRKRARAGRQTRDLPSLSTLNNKYNDLKPKRLTHRHESEESQRRATHFMNTDYMDVTSEGLRKCQANIYTLLAKQLGCSSPSNKMVWDLYGLQVYILIRVTCLWIHNYTSSNYRKKFMNINYLYCNALPTRLSIHPSIHPPHTDTHIT